MGGWRDAAVFLAMGLMFGLMLFGGPAISAYREARDARRPVVVPCADTVFLRDSLTLVLAELNKRKADSLAVVCAERRRWIGRC